MISTIGTSIRVGMREGDAFTLAMLSSLLGARPHLVFPILMAVWYTLTALGAFVLAAYTLRMGRQAALLTSLLVALQPVLQWAILDNFLSQAGGSAIWAFVLVAVLSALWHGPWRGVVLAGLLVATLATLYHAYLVYLVLIVAISSAAELGRRVRQRHARTPAARALLAEGMPFLTRGLGMVAVTLLSIPVAWILFARMARMLSGSISRAGIAPGVLGNHLVFPHPGEIIGLINHGQAAFALGLPQLPQPLATSLLLGAAVLALYGLRHSQGRQRWLLLGGVLTFSTVLWQQRFWLNQGQGYAYGYYKVMALASPFAVTLLVYGCAAYYRRVGQLSAVARAASRGITILLLGSTLAIAAVHCLTTASVMSQQALVVDRSMLEVQQASALVPYDEPLLVMDRRAGASDMWATYMLDHSAVFYYQPPYTYVGATGAQSPRLIRYALKDRHAEWFVFPNAPWFDAEAHAVIWQNQDYSLLRRKDQALADLPLMLSGKQHQLDRTISISVDGQHLRVSGQDLPGGMIEQRLAGAPGQLELTVFSHHGGTLILRQGRQEHRHQLPLGIPQIVLDAGQPLTIELQQLPGPPMQLMGVRVLKRAEE